MKLNQINKTIIDKLLNYYDIENVNTSIVKTTRSINIYDNHGKLDCIINLGILNNIRRINKFHESVNSKLKDNGIYISCAETLTERENRKKRKMPVGFKKLFAFIDFIYKRVIPKVPGFKQIYFGITKGHNRVLSEAEILGRLISCGFEIKENFEFEKLSYVISKKISPPSFNTEASYGLLFKMKRVGFRGEIIFLYKFRTMYPFSEYLQESLYNQNKLSENGDKIVNDSRITSWGRVFRKFWIDELPQLFNWLKGDLNLVGIRAVSKVKFNLFEKELQELRIKIKPGLIPPFYADLPKSFIEFQNSEKRYILSKLKNPISTDLKYFFRAFINIVFKGARSQ